MSKTKYNYIVYGIGQGNIKEFRRLKDAEEFIKNDVIPFDIDHNIKDKYMIIKEKTYITTEYIRVD